MIGDSSGCFGLVAAYTFKVGKSIGGKKNAQPIGWAFVVSACISH